MSGFGGGGFGNTPPHQGGFPAAPFGGGFGSPAMPPPSGLNNNNNNNNVPFGTVGFGGVSTVPISFAAPVSFSPPASFAAPASFSAPATTFAPPASFGGSQPPLELPLRLVQMVSGRQRVQRSDNHRPRGLVLPGLGPLALVCPITTIRSLVSNSTKRQRWTTCRIPLAVVELQHRLFPLECRPMW
jgi:hypothetical protein